MEQRLLDLTRTPYPDDWLVIDDGVTMALCRPDEFREGEGLMVIGKLGEARACRDRMFKVRRGDA